MRFLLICALVIAQAVAMPTQAFDTQSTGEYRLAQGLAIGLPVATLFASGAVSGTL